MRIEKFGFSPVVGDLAMIGNEVMVVKESDLMNVKMSQIVLPLPGIDSLYPEHEIKDAYVDFMKRDGLDIFNMDRKQKYLIFFML
jgi:tRNA(Glu) U13 pseudouridine synthase TruD